MSGIESPAPHEELTGQALMRDFRVAMDVAEEIGKFESWALYLGEGLDKELAITSIQNDPLNHPGVILSDEELSSLLSSDQEQSKIDELAEQSRLINLQRFIGEEAVFSTDSTDVPGPFKRYVWAGSMPGHGQMVPSGAPRTNIIMSDITSLLPSAGIIRVGENNNRSLDRKYVDVQPIDPETGEQVVQIKLTK